MSLDATTISTNSERSRELSDSEKSSLTTVINLSHRNLSFEELKGIAGQFNQPQYTTSVHTLRLNSNNLRDDGARLVAQLLPSYASLTSLDLGFCDLTSLGMEYLAASLVMLPTLRVLYLAGNSISAQGCQHIGMLLAVNSSLQTLSLTANNAGPEGAHWLSQGLEYNSSLTSLALNVNQIGKEGVTYLSNSLGRRNNITQLNLSDNGIEDEGMNALSCALENHMRMKELELSFNKLGSGSMMSMLKHVRGYLSLTRLSIDNNRIGDEGAKYLSYAMVNMVNIEELNLSFNEISSMGLVSIVQTIQSSPQLSMSLRKLWLSGNTIENETAKMLATLLLQNSCLSALYLDHCAITSMGERFIGTGIASNPKCALRTVTGIELSKVLVLLGSAPQIGELSNDAALRFLFQMWQNADNCRISPSISLAQLSLGDKDASRRCSEPVKSTSNQSQSEEPFRGRDSNNLVSDPDYSSDDDDDYSSNSDDSDLAVVLAPAAAAALTTESGNGLAVQSQNDTISSQHVLSKKDQDDDQGCSDVESSESVDLEGLADQLRSDYEDDGALQTFVPVDSIPLSDNPSNLSRSLSERSLRRHGLSQQQHSPMMNFTNESSDVSTVVTQSTAQQSFPSTVWPPPSFGGDNRQSDDRDKSRLRTYIVNPEVIDVARKLYTIPFSSSELWELQQFYFCPPPTNNGDLYGSDKFRSSNAHQSDNDEDFRDSFERPKKKPSNHTTMAKINNYCRIKVILEDLRERGEDSKVLLLLRRLRYLEDCSGIYDSSVVESILIHDINDWKS